MNGRLLQAFHGVTMYNTELGSVMTFPTTRD